MKTDYEKTLMRMTKAQLIEECLNQQQRADEEHDKFCNAQDELDDVETYEEEFYELEEVKKLIYKARTSHMRYLELGVKSEKEEFEKLLAELLEIE